MKRIIIIVTLVLCMIAGAGIASAGAKPFPDLPDTPAYTSRYPVVNDIAALEARVDVLERDLAQTRTDLRIARNQIDVLILLRAHDVNRFDTLRANDLMVSAARVAGRCVCTATGGVWRGLPVNQGVSPDPRSAGRGTRTEDRGAGVRSAARRCGCFDGERTSFRAVRLYTTHNPPNDTSAIPRRNNIVYEYTI